MKNRFLRIMLSLSVLSNGLVATQCNISAEEFTEGDYIYTVENGEAVIYDVNDGLSGEVVIPDTIGGYTVGKIGMNAFSYTEITKIVIPDSVSVIENDAFYGCYNLNEVTMPSELVTIGKGAFAMCSSLTDIYIPSGVTSIGEDIFLACDSMIGITVDENNPSYSSQDGVLFNKDKTILLQYARGKEDSVYIIPDGVVSVGYNSFSGSENLKEITIPESTTLIDKYAFMECSGITNVIFGENITEIGEAAFDGCIGLTELTIPKGVTRVEKNVFAACKNLKKVTIPDGVTSIGEFAFSGSGIENVTIPDGVTLIGQGAFQNCDSLVYVSLPAVLNEIGESAFAGCKSLANINVDVNNMNYSSFEGSLFNKDKTTLIQYASGRGNTTYTIPPTVTNIGKNAFEGSENLTKVYFMNGTATIGEYAFSECENLKNVAIADSVTEVGNWAFYGSKNLENVYYSGSEEQWNNVSAGLGNDVLKTADITFNSMGDAPEILTSFGSNVSEWAAPEIEVAFEEGLIPEIMIGYDLTQKVNRGEFAAIALQLYETLIDSYVELPESCVFTDINGDINEEAVKKAYETQIAAGMSESLYKPLEFVNREQLATMLCRVIKKRWFDGWTLATDEEYHLDTTGVNPFADDADISLWAKPSVYYMTLHGIIAGVGDNKFAPRMTESQQHIADYASATREQALVLSLRILNKSGTEETSW